MFVVGYIFTFHREFKMQKSKSLDDRTGWNDKTGTLQVGENVTKYMAKGGAMLFHVLVWHLGADPVVFRAYSWLHT